MIRKITQLSSISLALALALALVLAWTPAAQGAPGNPSDQPATESSSRPSAAPADGGKVSSTSNADVTSASSVSASASSTAGASNSSNGPASSSGKTEPTGQVRGFLLSVKFEGSSSADGQVMDLNPTTGYNFNRWLGVDIGVPVYFVRSATAITRANPTGASGSGIGDFYFDGRITLENALLNYSGTATGAAPTGNQDKGQSTGSFTYNFDNNFSHYIWRFTPFADVAVGNSLFDQKFRKRPYTTLGHIAHFESGTQFSIWKSVSLSASLYDDLPWGGQKVISRVARSNSGPGGGSGGSGGAALPGKGRRGREFEFQHLILGGPDVARDNGYTVGVSASPARFLDLSVGFNHSVHLALNTVTFSVGFNISNLFTRSAP